MSAAPRIAHNRNRLLLLAVTAALVVAVYILRVLAMGTAEVSRTDYVSQQVAGTVVSQGHASHLYDDGVQSSVYTQLVAGDHAGVLPYNHAPLSAFVALPISGLDLVTGHRVWGLFQLLLVLIGCAAVAATAPWRAGSRRLALASVLLALAGAGTLPLLTEGQDLGTITCGLGLAYAAWRSGRLALGAAVLVISACLAKPHLALGLLAFMLAWRDRRVLLGLVAGGGAVLAASVLAVGWAGCVAFLEAALRANGLGPEASQMGVTGLFATWFGEGAAATVAGYISGLAALAVAARLGLAVRRDRTRLEAALIGAAVMSLLASPHLFAHDLTLLAPMLVAAIAAASRSARQGWALRAVLVSWMLITVASGADSAAALPAAVGKLTPVVLAAAGWLALHAAGARTPWRRSPHGQPLIAEGSA